MSSNAFEIIYDNAAAVVKSQCGPSSDVNKVLKDFRSRALVDEKDPLKNRNLIVEPIHEAQVLEVSSELVEKIASELHRLNILHIWVRVTCPANEDDELTVVETDNPKLLRETLASSCPHCGQLHEEIDWEHINTFYAFHFDQKPDKFKFSLFYRKAQRLPSSKGERTNILLRFGRWLKGGPLLRFFPQGTKSPATTVIGALQTNAPTTQIPSQKETLNKLWSRVAFCALGGLGLSFIISRFSVTWAIICGAVLLFCLLVLAWITWKAIWAAASTERRVLTCGYLLALACLGASTGLSFGGGVRNYPQEKPKPNQNEVNNWKLDVNWRFGETNSQFVWATVVVFLGTSLIVYGLNWNRVRHQ